MMLANNYFPTQRKIDEITSRLDGFLVCDTWDLSDDNFNLFDSISFRGRKRTIINFSYFSDNIKKEVKFFFANRLKAGTLKATTVIGYSKRLKCLSEFFEVYYPNIYSVAEIPIDKGIIKLRSFLLENKIKDVGYITVLKQLFEFYKWFYDERVEFDKDIWDCRNIPGFKVLNNESNYSLNFMDIPPKFRDLAKRFIKIKTKYSYTTCIGNLDALKVFLKFVLEKFPQWDNLNNLTRKDIEEFLAKFKDHPKGKTVS